MLVQGRLAGLARVERNDRGWRRSLCDEVRELAEGLALQKPPLGPTAIHRELCRVAAERGYEPPRFSTVYNVICALPDALKTLALDGDKRYREAYDLIHRREASQPNEIWQADHTQLDLWARRDNGEVARPWLTVVVDDHSRAVAGFLFMFESPSAAQTALALRPAIWRKPEPHWIVSGIPETLYTDNGSDFTSSHLEQVTADLKMRLVFSTPGHPRGRGKIERFFGTVNQMFLCSLPGYIDRGAVRGEPTLTLSDLDRRFREFLREYHARPHGETKLPPGERWRRDGFLPRMPESLEQLDLLLLTVAKTRIVRPDGIRFQGMRYIDSVLAAYVGETVLLRYDPRDVAEIRLFHRGKFLCRAICPDLAGQTVALRDISSARNRRRRELGQTLKERRATVDALLDLRRGELSPPASGEAGAGAAVQHVPPLKRYLNE
jgi:putative transposase